jgi:hypothetical protein
MTRIALILLTVGAFTYAVWLVLRGKPLPQPGGTRGLKRRFLLATLLFVGLLSQTSRAQSGAASDPAVADPNTPSHVVATEDVWVTIKTVWRTLDPTQAEVFRQYLETAVADGQVRQRVADILSTAFTQIATYNTLTHLPSTGSTVRALQNYPEPLAKYALWGIWDLRKALEMGQAIESASLSAQSVLSRELEMMWLVERTKPDESMALDALSARYLWSASRIDSAVLAAQILVEMEGGALLSLTPLARLQTMQSVVGDLFWYGPAFSDWQTSSISPSIESMLQEMNLVNPHRYITCYRSLPRVTERTTELKDLQAVLLQKCVDANVVDEQVAAWAVDPNGADPNAVDSHAVSLPLDFALEKEIRTYQKQIRCVMVELYNRGEVPSSFVRDVELAADVEILPVDSIEARHRDMGYFFHALLDCPSKEPFAAALEDRGLIPPAQNHRMVTYNYNASCDADPNEGHIAQFISLLDSGEDVTLKDDYRVVWPISKLPSEDLEYRMTMRRVCRILTELGYTDANWTTAVEKAIGVPIIATIADNPMAHPDK